MKAEPQAEHRWLDKLIGVWTATSVIPPQAGQDETTVEWTESVRSLHDLWIVSEGSGEMPGGEPMMTLTTLGYDPRRQAFVGVWIGSMMTHMWVYEGHLDESGAVLTLDCEGPDFGVEGRTARYQDIIAIKDDDHRVLTSRMLDANGNWQQIMSADYRRTG